MATLAGVVQCDRRLAPAHRVFAGGELPTERQLAMVLSRDEPVDSLHRRPGVVRPGAANLTIPAPRAALPGGVRGAGTGGRAGLGGAPAPDAGRDLRDSAVRIADGHVLSADHLF